MAPRGKLIDGRGVEVGEPIWYVLVRQKKEKKKGKGIVLEEQNSMK